MERYRLISGSHDRTLAWARGVLVELLALGFSWFLLINSSTRVNASYWWFTVVVCVLAILGPGPLLILDALTKAVRISEDDISIISIIDSRGKKRIRWEDINRLRIQSNPTYASQVEKIVVSGRYRVKRLFGQEWRTTEITIPGHLPDTQRILLSLRKHVPDSVYEEMNSDR